MRPLSCIWRGVFLRNLTLNKERAFILAISVLAVAALACNAALPLARPSGTPTQGTLPLTEADVPRVTAEEAKAGFDRGEAIILDVRDEGIYSLRHIKGALSFPLTDIEADPNALNVDKQQWIITYCT
jgi:rhodanese-like protein